MCVSAHVNWIFKFFWCLQYTLNLTWDMNSFLNSSKAVPSHTCVVPKHVGGHVGQLDRPCARLHCHQHLVSLKQLNGVSVPCHLNNAVLHYYSPLLWQHNLPILIFTFVHFFMFYGILAFFKYSNHMFVCQVFVLHF